MESKKPLKHDYRALGSSLASLRVGVGTYSTPPAHLMYSLEKQNAAPSNIHESARCMLRPAKLIVLPMLAGLPRLCAGVVLSLAKVHLDTTRDYPKLEKLKHASQGLQSRVLELQSACFS